MANAAVTSIIVIVFTLLNLWFVYLSFLPGQDFEAELAAINSRIRDSLSDTPSNAKETTGDAPSPSPSGSEKHDQATDTTEERSSNPPSSSGEKCDLSKGNWVPDSTPPLYTNETCKFIQPNQNCVKNGRPDLTYLNWRWKPDDCELPPLDPRDFLRRMTNKKMIFIGDSMARNHMQSLLCALAQVEEPHKLERPQIIFFEESDKEMRWGFDRHNFTLTHIWSPFLVKFSPGTSPSDPYRVFLDTPDDIWASKVLQYDVAVISTGYWYYRPSVYYNSSKVLGCNPCNAAGDGVTKVDQLEAYRLAYRSVLGYLLREFRGVTIARTVTVDHFEHGAWYAGGVCNRTVPYSPGSVRLPFMSSGMNRIQREEVERAKVAEVERGKVAGLANASRFDVLDVTYSAFMRPDGHPNFFKTQEPGKPRRNDCLHWCLPGAVDTWNHFIYQKLLI
ncbi:protein trichome birefringence-like 25 [Selaginella moellendorffii]|uniref:protein trichome birefringence-like 25 n=1 Tax=Selaginella moellendorffii TaxID=88036 RepID=UPI000D1C9AAF|nr:protein trichome birefringence-like 25 [Selaginella moellendorffii]|eukprot:XP_024545327.1 protein trichome birefringence-like 25 [Selaginella moellendorffii]